MCGKARNLPLFLPMPPDIDRGGASCGSAVVPLHALPGTVLEKNATLTTKTASVTFNPSVSIGSTLTSLNFDFDLNLPNSITIDANNNVAVTPIFTASAATIVAENLQEEDDGSVDDLVGFVTAASGSSFSISAQDASQTLTFAVDGNTQFEGVSGASALSNGMIVEVSAVTQPDNFLLATHVEVRIANANAEEAEGLITQVTGTPATQFNIVVREDAAFGSVFPALGSILTVNLAQNTLYNSSPAASGRHDCRGDRKWEPGYSRSAYRSI